MNKFETALQKVCAAFVKVFTDAEIVAVAAEPFVDILFPAVAPIYNSAANGAAAAKAAGQAAVVPGASEEQNLINVTVAIEPVLVKYSQASGLTTPTTATILAYAQALMPVLKLV